MQKSRKLLLIALVISATGCTNLPNYQPRSGDDYTRKIESLAEQICGEPLGKQDPISRHLCLDNTDKSLRMATFKAGHDYLVESKLPAQAERNKWETRMLPVEMITRQLVYIAAGIGHIRGDSEHEEGGVNVTIGHHGENPEGTHTSENWDAELLRGLLNQQAHGHNAVRSVNPAPAQGY